MIRAATGELNTTSSEKCASTASRSCAFQASAQARAKSFGDIECMH
jgi:hypothetical protein